jgi:hypothetical protein
MKETKEEYYIFTKYELDILLAIRTKDQRNHKTNRKVFYQQNKSYSIPTPRTKEEYYIFHVEREKMNWIYCWL